MIFCNQIWCPKLMKQISDNIHDIPGQFFHTKLKIRGRLCWVPYRVGPAHMHCQSSFMSLFQKSSMQVFSFNEKWPKHEEVWLLNEKCSKVSCHFLGQWLRRVRHAETDRAEKGGKQKPFGLVVSWSKNRELKQECNLAILCVSSRGRKTQWRG